MVKPGLKNEKPLGSKSRQDSLLEEHSVLLRKTTTKNWPRKQLRQTTNKRLKEGDHTNDKPLTITNNWPHASLST